MEINASVIILFCVFISIIVYGKIRVPNLKADEKKTFIKKNIAIAAIPFSLIFFLNQPTVFPISFTEMQMKEKAVISETAKKTTDADIETRQTIDNLKRDVVMMRSEIKKINDFYGLVFRTVLIGLLAFIIARAFKKEE